MPNVKLTKDEAGWKSTVKWSPDEDVSWYGASLSESLRGLAEALCRYEQAEAQAGSKRSGRELIDGAWEV